MIQLHRLLAILLVACGLGWSFSDAQGSSRTRTEPSLEPGDRVRVVVPELRNGRFEARVAATTDSTVTLYSAALRPREQSLPLSSIAHLEISEGEKTKVARNAGIGLLMGAGLGAIFGYAAGDDTSCFICFSAEEKAAVGAIGLGAIGLLVGGISGATTREETWRPVSVDRLGLGIAPDGRPGLVLAFDF